MRRLSITFLICIIVFTSFSNVTSQWAVTANLNGGSINSIKANENLIYAGTSSQGIFRSNDQGSEWTQVNSGLGNSLLIQSLSLEGDHVYAGTSSGGFFYSVNNGNDWIQSNQGISQQNIKSIITDADTVYAGCYFAGVFRSVNNGSNWSRFALGEGDLLFALFKNENNFLIGLYGGIYRSTNNGANWFISQTGITDINIRSIVQMGNKLYCATYGGGVFVSVNSGGFWTPVSSGLSDLRINILSTYGNELFAGTYSKGIYHFDNSTNIWIPVNKGLTDTSITSIAFHNNYIFAASVSGKIWKRPLPEIITDINVTGNQTSSSFELFQNYPNPFNPGTSISFSISERTHLSLKVFDGLGKELTEIFSGVLSEGIYSKFWNAEIYPAGVYYYRLESGTQSVTGKMLLIK